MTKAIKTAGFLAMHEATRPSRQPAAASVLDAPHLMCAFFVKRLSGARQSRAPALVPGS